MAIVISVINWKGGVGKTTLTHHIATGLCHLKFKEYTPKILLIDLDAQCNLSISCLSDDEFEKEVYNNGRFTVKDLLGNYFVQDNPNIDFDDFIISDAVRAKQDRYNVIKYEGIDLVASHQDLIYTDMDIASFSRPSYQNNLLNKESYKFKFLKNFIRNLNNTHEYDFIFIDCPPNLNFITQNALYASDYYIIPTILDKLSTYGILSITNKVKELNKMFSAIDDEYTKTKLLGIIPNNVVERSGEPKYSQNNRLTTLKGTFKNKVFENYLTYGDGIASSSALGLPVYGINGENARKQEDLMLKVVHEMLERIIIEEDSKRGI